MKALGQGSIASITRFGLSVVAAALWLVLGVVSLSGLTALIAGLFVANGTPPLLIGPELAVSREGILLSGEGPGVLSWPLVASLILAAGAMLIGALVIVDRLRRLYVNFTSNEPFNHENANHLRTIWIVMLLMEVAKYGFAFAVAWSVSAFGAPEGVNIAIEPRIDLSTWASILILIVLAEVFREGTRIREDQDLTI